MQVTSFCIGVCIVHERDCLNNEQTTPVYNNILANFKIYLQPPKNLFVSIINEKI